MRLSAESSDDYPRHGHSAITLDALPKFIEAIDRLRTASIDQKKFKFTEIEYNYENIKVVVFNNLSGKIMISIQIGDVSVNFSDVNALLEIKELINRAINHIEMHRIDGS